MVVEVEEEGKVVVEVEEGGKMVEFAGGRGSEGGRKYWRGIRWWWRR